MSPSTSKRHQRGRKGARKESEKAEISPAVTPASNTLARAAVPQGSTSRQAPSSRPKPPFRAPPLLSKRQMEDLLRGNRDNRITVKVEDEPVCTLLRPVATHFSCTWRRALANIYCRAVNVAIPSADPQATLAENSPSLPNDAHSHPTPENLAPSPSDHNAIKFIVQWMERGGADPIGKHALLYPRGNEQELKRLRGLVTTLEIEALITRTNRDIAAIRPKYCTLCKTTGHLRYTCLFCIYCRERTHMRDDCPRLRAKEEREWARVERERRRDLYRARQDLYRARQEEEEQRSLERGIRTGRVAVGSDGKTIWL